MARKNTVVVLTRRAAVEEALAAALEDERHHVVPVRESGVLGAVLGRGAALVVADLALPETALQEAAHALQSFRGVPLLTVADGPVAGRHTAPGPLRDSVLDEQTTWPPLPEALRAQVRNLIAKAAFLAGQELVGDSQAMRELRERVLLIAPTPIASVLVTGESGSGKELVAHALHRHSGRRDHPFVPINCAAIPENLLESELFGHEKGAFTDAKAQRHGLFEQGDGGTVFLDEIGEMPASAQTRLLRVLEQREVTRVGGSTAIPVDVRVVAATNLDLQAAVARREFRIDVYHRLKVVQLEIPPLRQRPEDIPQLIDHFVAQFAADGGHFEGFTPAAGAVLRDYDWPGNVRELRNLMEHLVFLGPRRPVEPRDLLPHLERPPVVTRPLPVATGRTPDQSERELIYFALLDLRRELSELRRLIEESLLRGGRPQPTPVYQLEEAHAAATESDAEVAAAPAAVEPLRTLKDLEREAIVEALRRVNGNRRQVAQILGISARTLYRKLDEYGLK